MDLGGTWFRWEVNGKIHKVPSEDFLPTLHKVVTKYRPKKIAIAVAGQVYGTKIFSAPNLPFAPLDLAPLQKEYGTQILLENDLNCAALAESHYQKEPFLAAIYAGTGLGSGIVENGKLCKGFLDRAGEIGHIPFKETPFRCGCGKNNCAELFASGSGIEKWANKLGCSKDFATTCATIKKNFLEALCHATATLLCLTNPKKVVFGGGVIVHNPQIVDTIKERIHHFAPPFSLEGVTFLLTNLEDAPLQGAKIILEKENE